ncbi:uncharacterized protein ACA1_182900 [Acanthamoeba castellanii str. Neff]|uniref:Uncharacterized protein n=1 Tax=Acanthamoeba castellanii (strain ATCC 30010 / Neff) TaxID=1257118 RepID=L8HA85_ACACF|nr:uncharacterized protein ACA1_182900 [Acanthamoeba castellanii str. Neff]ELR21356.1 hypothetical protein ACA1_182900 [Acanthamoeba castellanii str. Neff]
MASSKTPGLWSRIRAALRPNFTLHPVPTAPDYVQYPTNFRVPYSKTEYSPETIPAKAHRDLSTIYYWRHAAGKRSPPVPRKPDVLKELEKEGSATGPARVGGLTDITELRITRPPGEMRKWNEIPNELYQ